MDSRFLLTILNFLPVDCLNFSPASFARTIVLSHRFPLHLKTEVGSSVGAKYGTTDTNAPSCCYFSSLFTVPTPEPRPLRTFGTGTRLGRSKISAGISTHSETTFVSYPLGLLLTPAPPLCHEWSVSALPSHLGYRDVHGH